MLKEYYWEVLKDTQDMHKEMDSKGDPHEESDQIFAIAIACLIKHGAKFETVSNKDEIEKALAENNKNKGILSNNKPVPVPDLKEEIVISHMDGSTYSCDAEQIKQVMGSDYYVYIEKTAVKEQQIEDYDIELPDIETEPEKPEQDIPENAPVEAEEKERKPEMNQATPQEQDHMPEFKGDNRYNRDPDGQKGIGTFCYTQAKFTLTPEEGQEVVIEFLVYPLDFKENTNISDIVVIAGSNGMIRSGVSQGRTAAVKINFGDLQFVVRGKWEDSEFIAQIQPIGTEIEKLNPSIETEFHLPGKRSYSTFVMAKHGNQTYNMFPAEIGHNSLDGYCYCIVAIPGNEDISILSPTEEGNFLLDEDGKMVTLAAYWEAEGEEMVFHYEFTE